MTLDDELIESLDLSRWCARRELNPHALRHWNLNPLHNHEIPVKSGLAGELECIIKQDLQKKEKKTRQTRASLLHDISWPTMIAFYAIAVYIAKQLF